MRLLLATLVLLSATLWSGVSPDGVSAQRRHRVRAGDTWNRIARRYRVTAWNLASENRMRPTHMLRPGQEIRVPSRGVVFVAPRQTLSHIARQNRCSIEALARANRIRTSTPLRVGQRLHLPGSRAAVGAVTREDWGEPAEAGVARVTGRLTEQSSITLIDGEGRVPTASLRQLAEAMRRGEGDTLLPPTPRLAFMLAKLSDHFGGRPIRIVSGFRQAGGGTRGTSRHVAGSATDIAIAGVPARAIWDFCRSLRRTGCGLYPRSSFVHVDVRASNAQWVDWSGPGQRALQGNLDGPFRRRRRRRGRRPPRRRGEARVGRHVTRADLVPMQVELVGGDRAWLATTGIAAHAFPLSPLPILGDLYSSLIVLTQPESDGESEEEALEEPSADEEDSSTADETADQLETPAPPG